MTVINMDVIPDLFCYVDALEDAGHRCDTSITMAKVLNEKLPCDECGRATVCDRECRAFNQYASKGKFKVDDVNSYKHTSPATIKL